MADTMTLEQVRSNMRDAMNSVLKDDTRRMVVDWYNAIDAAIKQLERDANSPLKGWIFDKLAETLRDATYVAGMLDAICETDGIVDHMQARDAAFRVRDALQAHTAEVTQAQSVPGELAEPIEGAFNYEQKLAFTEGWNACRDAMLAAAPQQEPTK